VQVSQITPTGTTCSQFASGTASTLASVAYSLKNNTNIIGQTNPGVFFYWVKVTVPAGSNTFTVNQSITTGNFNTFFVLTSGSNVFNANCVDGLKPNITQFSDRSGSNVMVQWNAPSAGTYFISIKYSTSSVVGVTAPTPSTVHYVFSTVGVPGSTSGLDLVKKPTGKASIVPNTTPAPETRTPTYMVVARMITWMLFGT
jgi:hypothetical protein